MKEIALSLREIKCKNKRKRRERQKKCYRIRVLLCKKKKISERKRYITMMNLNNFGIGEGRVTKKPVAMDNKDGSKKVFVTVAIQDNFASGADKEKKTQFVNFEGFVPKDRKSSVYDKLEVGDKIAVQYRIETPSYEKDGEKVYKTALVIENIQFKESMAEKTARQARHAADAAAADAE